MSTRTGGESHDPLQEVKRLRDHLARINQTLDEMSIIQAGNYSGDIKDTYSQVRDGVASLDFRLYTLEQSLTK